MSEIVQLGVGQRGAGLLTAFWRALSVPSDRWIDPVESRPRCALEVQAFRKQLEACDSPEGVLLFLDGCCDTATVQSVVEPLNALTERRLHIDATCFIPAEASVDRIWRDYHNCTRNLAMLNAECDSVQLLDTCALLDIANFVLRTQNGTMEKLYDIAVSPMATFVDALNSVEEPSCQASYVKVISCMTHAFPFYVGGYAPYKDVRAHKAVTVRDLCWGLYRPENLVVSVNPFDGRYVSACAAFRGGPDLTLNLLKEQISATNMHSALSDDWREGLPRRIHAYLDNRRETAPLETAFFGSTTALGRNIEYVLRQVKNGPADVQVAREQIQQHVVDLCDDISKYIMSKTLGKTDHAFLWHQVDASIHQVDASI